MFWDYKSTVQRCGKLFPFWGSYNNLILVPRIFSTTCHKNPVGFLVCFLCSIFLFLLFLCWSFSFFPLLFILTNFSLAVPSILGQTSCCPIHIIILLYTCLANLPLCLPWSLFSFLIIWYFLHILLYSLHYTKYLSFPLNFFLFNIFFTWYSSSCYKSPK